MKDKNIQINSEKEVLAESLENVSGGKIETATKTKTGLPVVGGPISVYNDETGELIGQFPSSPDGYREAAMLNKRINGI